LVDKKPGLNWKNLIMIPYGKQDITKSDIDLVVKTLKSDFITQGPKVPEFENYVKTYCGATFAVAVNSATSALHIACLSLGLTKGDFLWTTPITFVASANCGLYCGAQVDFVDIDPLTYNLSVKALEEKLVDAEKNGKLPKVVVPVHFSGQSCDMKEIYDLSQQYGFSIIEDASHAIGGRYRNGSIGNCKYSDITIFSFHPVKIITTGEGGMALTNSELLSDRMKLLCSHGITKDPNKMNNSQDGPWYHQQIDLGFNYRMSDIHAALGISQLKRLNQYVLSRHEIANRYNSALEDFDVKLPYQHSYNYSSFHLYVVRLNGSNSKLKRLNLFKKFNDHGIGVNLHYIPIYKQPYYQNLNIEYDSFPESELYYEEAITLPIFPNLHQDQQQRIIDILCDQLKED
jgi:UDP-4-amino-4,6-dideoxy-N-acetyl-beta-L-altrosamine transaminase